MTPLKRLSLDLGFLFSKLQLNELRLKPLIWFILSKLVLAIYYLNGYNFIILNLIIKQYNKINNIYFILYQQVWIILDCSQKKKNSYTKFSSVKQHFNFKAYE